LRGEALPGGKLFFKSYKKWNSLTSDQRNKATAYFNMLSDGVKIAVRNQVDNLSREAGNVARQQAAVTSGNDRARFMHAMVDPANQPALSAANTPLDRRQLDYSDGRQAPWDTFADNFNNYDQFIYQNATIQHVNGIPVNPYAAEPGFEGMAVFTHSINPQDDSRPYRDGAWCEKMWKEIRGIASRINENYRRSGNQEAENPNTEWLEFCANYSDVYKYARAVMNDGLLDNMGRALPGNQQRDTGALEPDAAATALDANPRPGRGYRRVLSNTPGAVNRKRQRDRSRAMAGGGNSPDDIASGLTEVVELEMAKSRKLRALTFLANYEGNDPDRLERSFRANALLEEEAFGTD
jgi:hypothetical protein